MTGKIRLNRGHHHGRFESDNIWNWNALDIVGDKADAMCPHVPFGIGNNRKCARAAGKSAGEC